jgi:hypothetical protein
MTDNSSSVLFLRRCGLIPVEYGKSPKLDARLLAQNITLPDTQYPEQFGAAANGSPPPDTGVTPDWPLRLS